MTVRNTTRLSSKDIDLSKSRTRSDAPEAEPLGEDFWRNAKVVRPGTKRSVHLRVDPEVWDWFKAGGEGHLTRMNDVLRAYVRAKERESTRPGE